MDMNGAIVQGGASRRGGDGKPRVAVISDLHANLAALQAVFDDIDALGIREVWCLGDIVGYGPRPAECARLVRERCAAIIKGNHETALEPEGAFRFTLRARAAIAWTRGELDGQPDGAELVKWLQELPPSFEKGDRFFVHGSPAEPTEEYLMPRDAGNPYKMDSQWPRVRQYAFCGHTHIPGVFEEGVEHFTRSEEMLGGNAYLLDNSAKAIINVGSVGQPRDRNPDACYVTFDGDSVVYRRVRYDVEETRRLILLNTRLDPFLADRLVEGR